MSRSQLRIRNRWLLMTMIFILGPIIMYMAFLHPLQEQISSYRESINQKALGSSPLDLRSMPSSRGEMEQLEEIKLDQLSRVKKVDGRESLLRFSGALADALAYQARSRGLKVIGVRFQNCLIKGDYVPAGDQAITSLADLSSAIWEELTDPLDLPLLQLPYIEIEMSVASTYARVFSFIEALPEFPALVQLTGLRTSEGVSGTAYRLIIRGYYFAKGGIRRAESHETFTAENSF